MDIYRYTFLNAIATDYLTCYLVLLAERKEHNVVRVLFASLTGAFFEAVSVYTSSYGFAVKIIISVVMVLCLEKEYKWRELVLSISLFLLITCAFVGAEKLFAEVLSKAKLAPFALCIGVSLTVAAMRLTINGLKLRKMNAAYEYKVVASANGVSEEVTGYYDSGNKLLHSGAPVVVLSESLAERLKLSFNGELAVRTVTGIRLMKLSDLDLKIYYQSGAHKIYHAQAIVTKNINSKGHQLILHRDMGEEQ